MVVTGYGQVYGTLSSPSWQIDGKIMKTVLYFIFWGFKITADGDSAMKLRCFLLGRKVMTHLDNILKSRDITLPTKVHLVKAMFFPVVIWMWELDYKESWELKNWCFWTVVLEKTLRVPWAARSNQPIRKEISPEYSLEGLMLKPKLQYFGHRMRKTDWIWKDPNAGKDWRWEEKWSTEDEMVGWHHRLTGHKFEQALGIGDGQGGLACCSPWGHKESDVTELNHQFTM